jgi:hypothetical protein
MHTRLISTLALLIVITFAAPAFAQRTVPIDGTVSTGGTFQGTYDIERFLARQGQIFAEGTLQGIITQPGGVTRQVQPTSVELPVTFGQSSCQILEVRLGAVTVDLLGLQVTLSLVTLTVEAQQGQGNLLGNLLCAIANLFDARSQAIVNMLDRILGAL